MILHVAGKGIETVICLRHTIQLLAPIVQTLEEGLEELKHSKCTPSNVSVVATQLRAIRGRYLFKASAGQ